MCIFSLGVQLSFSTEPFQCIKWSILTSIPLPTSPVWPGWTLRAWRQPMRTSAPAAKPVAFSTIPSGRRLGPPLGVRRLHRAPVVWAPCGTTRTVRTPQVSPESPLVRQLRGTRIMAPVYRTPWLLSKMEMCLVFTKRNLLTQMKEFITLEAIAGKSNSVTGLHYPSHTLTANKIILSCQNDRHNLFTLRWDINLRK